MYVYMHVQLTAKLREANDSIFRDAVVEKHHGRQSLDTKLLYKEMSHLRIDTDESCLRMDPGDIAQMMVNDLTPREVLVEKMHDALFTCGHYL